MSASSTDTLHAARAALDRHAWQEAFDLLTGAGDDALSPRDLEGLGEAAWWVGRGDAVVDARERAYTGYLEEGNKRRAAYVALTLARDYTARLNKSQASGWFKRAHRLLEDEPESVEHGWLERTLTHIALDQGDFDAATEHADRMLEIGTRFGDKDLQAMGLHDKGQALVAKGQVDDGLALMDEAMVAAVGGELSPWPTGAVYCNTINTCSRLADYRRAGEWAQAAKRWCERQSIAGFPGVCRVKQAEITKLRGAWREAEEEALRACNELQETGLWSFAAAGFYELGEVRMRMGELDAAEDAFRQAHEQGANPQPGLAFLRLAQGKPEAALSMIRRALGDDSTDRLERARMLPALVEIGVAAGDLASAQAAAAELDEIAAGFPSLAQEARAAVARGTVQLAEGEPGAAISSLKRGWQLWTKEDVPYEAARARLLLGQSYRADGDEEAAAMELGAARAAFEQLGAVPDAWRAAELLKGPDGAPPRRVSKAFMFTDIVSSTNLVEAIGDEAWEDLTRWHDQALRTCFGEHGGEEVDHAGDGFFVAFPDPTSALACAVDIQRKLSEHRRTAGFAPQVRIGVHAAEATERGGDYGGRGVHEAARIGGLAGGGEIVATEDTVAGAGDGFATGDPREVELKGISHPVRVVTVAWR